MCLLRSAAENIENRVQGREGDWLLESSDLSSHGDRSSRACTQRSDLLPSTLLIITAADEDRVTLIPIRPCVIGAAASSSSPREERERHTRQAQMAALRLLNQVRHARQQASVHSMTPCNRRQGKGY